MEQDRRIEHLKLLRQLQREIGELQGEPILKRYRHWQNVKSPDLKLDQCPYDPAWTRHYDQAARRIAEALTAPDDDVTKSARSPRGASREFEIHHIGSTSIPGMAAKPIVDMAVALVGRDDLAWSKARLSKIGYRGWGMSPAHPEVEWLWHEQSAPVQRVIHLCAADNVWLRATVNFRDYLRRFPEKKDEYMRLKQALSVECGTDLPLYSLKKACLLHRINIEADRWREGGS